jgi:hypothetical protein
VETTTAADGDERRLEDGEGEHEVGDGGRRGGAEGGAERGLGLVIWRGNRWRKLSLIAS